MPWSLETVPLLMVHPYHWGKDACALSQPVICLQQPAFIHQCGAMTLLPSNQQRDGMIDFQDPPLIWYHKAYLTQTAETGHETRGLWTDCVYIDSSKEVRSVSKTLQKGAELLDGKFIYIGGHLSIGSYKNQPQSLQRSICPVTCDCTDRWMLLLNVPVVS